jgi:hypothetical protein
VSPDPTPPPAPATQINQWFADASLPTGPDYRGRWAEFSASASGRGVGGHEAPALEPNAAVASDGTRYMAWVDGRSGNYQIYVARHTSADGWQ